MQLIKPRRHELIRVVLTRGEHERDPLRLKPSAREHESLGRGLVKPVRVIDERQSGPGSVAVANNPSVATYAAKRSTSDGSLSANAPLSAAAWCSGNAARHDNTGRSNSSSAANASPDSASTPRAQDAYPCGLAGRVVKQRRLADAPLPAYHQHTAAPSTRLLKQRV